MGDFQRISAQSKCTQKSRTSTNLNPIIFIIRSLYIIFISCFKQIPNRLVGAYSELLNSQPNKRLNATKFISYCRQPGGFMNNHFVDTLLFLEEIQVYFYIKKKFLSNFINILCFYLILKR